MFYFLAKRNGIIRRVSVRISLEQVTWRAKRKNTPLAPVILGASGYMTGCTAEQKSLELVQGLLAALISTKGVPRGNTREIFAYFAAGQSKCHAA